MKFARLVFCCTGALGTLVLMPRYFMYGKIGKNSPPPPTHPEFYYGFAGVTLAWQLAFFVIASDPAHLKPMMIPSVVVKLSYVIAVIVLYLQSRIKAVPLSTGAPDASLCVLFVVAFFKTRPSSLTGAHEVDL